MVQHGRAFTRGPLPLNPQTLFSAQGTTYPFFLTDPKVEMDRCAVCAFLPMPPRQGSPERDVDEWARIYERLVRRKCSFNEKTRQYTGRLTVVGRIAGQIISTIFVLLKQDQELLARLPPGTKPPEPALYDPEVHRRHCAGHYQAYTRSKLSNIIELPPH